MKKSLILGLFFAMTGVFCFGMEWGARGKYTAASPHSHIGFIYREDLPEPSSALFAMETNGVSEAEVFPVKFNYDDEHGCQQFILGRKIRVSWYPDGDKLEVKGLDPQKLSGANYIRMLVAVQYFDAKSRGRVVA